MAMPFFSAVDPAYVNSHSEAYIDTHPMGSGPFMLQSYIAGRDYVLVRNPHYFKKGIPYLNKIVFYINNSPTAVLFHFEQGKTGMISANQGGIPALEYAINKQAIVRIMSGLAIPANQIIPPSEPAGYEKVLPKNAQYAYNPALAKKLLAKAGYPHGFSTTIYTDNSTPTDLKIAEAANRCLRRSVFMRR